MTAKCQLITHYHSHYGYEIKQNQNSFVTLLRFNRHLIDMSRTIFDNQVMPATGKMYRYALSIIRDPDLAHDVVQDCLVKIWQKRQDLTGIKNIDAWVMRITRNRCLELVKKERPLLWTKNEFLHDDLAFHETEEADHDILVRDQLDWLERVIDSLPDKQKEVYHLREVGELTYKEIAEITSMSLSDVKITLHRTRARIRETIKKIETYGLAN